MEIIKAGKFVLGCSKETKEEIEANALQEAIALLAGRQNRKSSQIRRNLPYPKLDMKALEDFLDKLQNSDKYKEFNREMERQYEVCKEMGLLEQIEPSNKMVLDSEELRKLRQDSDKQRKI